MDEILDALLEHGMSPQSSFVRNAELCFLYDDDADAKAAAPVIIAACSAGTTALLDLDFMPSCAVVVTAMGDESEDEDYDEDDFDFSDDELDALEFTASVKGSDDEDYDEDDDEDDDYDDEDDDDYDDDDEDDAITANVDGYEFGELSDDEEIELLAFFGEGADDSDMVVVEANAETIFCMYDTYRIADGSTIVIAGVDEDERISVIHRNEAGEETARSAMPYDKLVSAIANSEKTATNTEAELRSARAQCTNAEVAAELDQLIEEISATTQKPKPSTSKPGTPSRDLGGREGRPADFGGSYGSSKRGKGMNVAEVLKAYGFSCKQGKDGITTAENDDVKMRIEVVDDDKMQLKGEVKAGSKIKHKTHPFSKAVDFATPEELSAIVESMGYSRVASARLAQLDSLVATSDTDVTMDLWEADDGPFWSIAINGSPVGQLHLQDQGNREVVDDLFCTDTFASSLKSAIVAFGPKEMMECHNVRLYEAVVHEADAIQQIKHELEETYAAKYASLEDGFRESFKNTAQVAITGLAKNWWIAEGGDPLKGALYDAMTERGVSNCVEIINAAYAAGAPPLIEALIARTYALQDLEPAAFEQVTAAIMDSPIKPIDDPSETIASTQTGAEYSAMLERGNMPLNTASAKDTDDSDFSKRSKKVFANYGRNRR